MRDFTHQPNGTVLICWYLENELDVRYRDGAGVKKDAAKSDELLRTAAEQFRKEAERGSARTNIIWAAAACADRE